MEQLTALGTGYAVATKCYTTCFTVSAGQEHFMIDTGGGNGVLTNLEKAGIAVSQVHHIFLSHRHTDHVLGAVWMLRMVGHGMEKRQLSGTTASVLSSRNCRRIAANVQIYAAWPLVAPYLASALFFIAWPTDYPLIYWTARPPFLTPTAKKRCNTVSP